MNTKTSQTVTKKCIILLPSSFRLMYDKDTETCSRLIQIATSDVTNLHVHLLRWMNTKICTGIPARVLVNLKQEVSVRTHFNKVCEHPLFLPVYLSKHQVSEELNMSTGRSGKLIGRIRCRILQPFQH